MHVIIIFIIIINRFYFLSPDIWFFLQEMRMIMYVVCVKKKNKIKHKVTAHKSNDIN